MVGFNIVAQWYMVGWVLSYGGWVVGFNIVAQWYMVGWVLSYGGRRHRGIWKDFLCDTGWVVLPYGSPGGEGGVGKEPRVQPVSQPIKQGRSQGTSQPANKAPRDLCLDTKGIPLGSFIQLRGCPRAR